MSNEFDIHSAVIDIGLFKIAMQTALFNHNPHILIDCAFLNTPSHIENSYKTALHPDEIGYSKALGKKRQTEFIVSRWLARNIFKQFSITNFPLLPLDSRMPNWPKHLIGSIAHSAELCMVAVAYQEKITSIGIDIEARNRLHPKLWSACLTDSEINFISHKPQTEQTSWATLIFSAKESFFKFQYPLTHQWLGFKEAEIVDFPRSLNDAHFSAKVTSCTYSHAHSTYTLKICKDLASPFTQGNLFKGRFLFTDTLVMTAFLPQ